MGVENVLGLFLLALQVSENEPQRQKTRQRQTAVTASSEHNTVVCLLIEM